jgi:DNA-binding transcriptional MerR regulator
MPDAPMTVSTAARVLRVSEASVKAFERRGLLPATRTESGVRLFAPRDVQRLATDRANRGDRGR